MVELVSKSNSLISLIPNVNPLQNKPFKKGDVIAQQRSMAPPSLCSGRKPVGKQNPRRFAGPKNNGCRLHRQSTSWLRQASPTYPETTSPATRFLISVLVSKHLKLPQPPHHRKAAPSGPKARNRVALRWML